ncbi:MAG: metallophosphoesterase family protein [Gammaproteobacteria bacterium]|nr:metallophosphoesterase family protein [Gammaproteobacteria bacterium]MBT6586931.1 metallophosphoesterase family protein [Gammaproteobacteria bacterium]MBT7877297.1 metallophosphoesterase family protein [Gammaproteobacteria bacterium]
MSTAGKIKKLGVIGDVHSEHQRLEAALVHLQGLDTDAIVCTGDIVDGIGCPNESIKLLDNAAVLTVRGNHDRWILEDKARHIKDAHSVHDLTEESLSYLASLPSQVTLDTIKGKLLLCHGIADDDLRKVWPGTEKMAIERSHLLDNIILEGEFKYLINGHMHFRTLIHFEALTLINAGTLRGEHWPGFSVIDFEAKHITAFEFCDGQICLVKTHDLTQEAHTVWSNTQSFRGGWDPVRLF